MFLHVAYSLQQTILHRMPDPDEFLRMGGIAGFVGGFDDEGVGESIIVALCRKFFLSPL
jgi:hypothetical protein